MGIYDDFADKPLQIKEAGEEISLKFIRTDENSGKLVWNIPPGVNGCKGEGAYDGIVLTVSRVPADYIESSPKNGQYYIGDPSVDPDLHSGSKLKNDAVLVVGAFYNDKETTELEVFDLEPRTAYYFSGYAVDNVARYHREGVHSYSLPTEQEESGTQERTPAIHAIRLDNDTKLTTPTGLSKNQTYELNLEIDCKEYNLKIKGVDALNYEQLINTINKKLAALEKPYKSPSYPFKNEIFLEGGKFYVWTGTNKEELDVIFELTDPSSPSQDTYWYDPDDKTLKVIDTSGTWADVDYTTLTKDITKPECDDIWLNSSTMEAWEWNGTTWCELNVVTGPNPLAPPDLGCSVYWYDEDSMQLFAWEEKLKRWEDALAIYSDVDPNEIGTDSLLYYWYDEDSTIYQYDLNENEWDVVNGFRIEEPNAEGNLESPVVGLVWYVPSEQKLYSVDEIDDEIVYIEITELFIFPTDPTQRESCDLWWNSDTDILYTWDKVNSEWDEVSKFFQSDNDPAKPQELPENSVWLDDNGSIHKILDTVCHEYDFIEFDFDPTNPPIGFGWLDLENKTLSVWNGTEWVEVPDADFIISTEDPQSLPDGTYWYNDSILQTLNQGSWEEVSFLEESPKPDEGFLWHNTTNDKLYMWEIDDWVSATAIAYVEFIEKKDTCTDNGHDRLTTLQDVQFVSTTGSTTTQRWKKKDALVFKTRKLGCDASIELKATNESVFSKLDSTVQYLNPAPGADYIDGMPLYRQLGIGDDGSPDERRQMHSEIRSLLGSGGTKVELKKKDIDLCINNALKMIRKYSGFGYKRGFFFLDLRPNQQFYTLTDKCVGFHKIAKVNAIFRLRSAFLRGAYSGYDIFGYAALKQLYTLGTFDILSFHLVSSFIEELETLFATRITFQFEEKTRELKLYNAVYKTERVLVDASVERTEQDLMVDREVSLWILRWAVAEAKMMLSQIRGKFQTLPGPTGTVLNAQELITQSESEKSTLLDELEDISMQDTKDSGLASYFVLG